MVKYNLLILASLSINCKIVFGELVKDVRKLDLQLILWNYFHFGNEDDIQFDNKLSIACARGQDNDKTGLLDYIAEVNNLILANGEIRHSSRGGDRITFTGSDAIFADSRWYSLDDSVVHSIASNLPVCQSTKIRLDLIGGSSSIDITRNVIIMDANAFDLPRRLGNNIWLIVAPIRNGYLFLRYFGFGRDPYRLNRGWIAGFGNPDSECIYCYNTTLSLVEDKMRDGRTYLQIKDFKARGANKELQKEAHREVLKGLPKGYFDNVDARGEFLKKYGSFEPDKLEESKKSQSKEEIVRKSGDGQSSISRPSSSGSKFEKGKRSSLEHDEGMVSGIVNLSLAAGKDQRSESFKPSEARKKNSDRSRSPIGKEKALTSIMGNDNRSESSTKGVKKNGSPSKSGRFHE